MAIGQERGRGEEPVLQRLFEITHDILQAQQLGLTLESIGRDLGELFGFRFVSIVASDVPGGEMYRRVLIGFPSDVNRERIGERISREQVSQLLGPEHEVVPHCFYIPAEHDVTWAHNIYTGSLALDAPRSDPQAWHERDSLILVLGDRDGVMQGYVSVDGPIDGCVPSRATLRQMQLFVNLVGLALSNARTHQSEVERRRILEETSRAQSDFFSMVSHEVRSPLAAIHGATELLVTHFDTLENERRRELLRVLGDSTTRLSGIFEDFLLLSRMDAGKLTLRFESVDPLRVIEESVARIESQYPDREFRTLCLEPIPNVYADEGRVVQVLTNFLSNAAKYSSETSVIAIELKPHADYVWFGVKNDGPGISQAEREKLFTRFGRVSSGGDNSIGLGLYISAELANLMGGRIGCESEPQRTTTFWFTLPRAKTVRERNGGSPNTSAS